MGLLALAIAPGLAICIFIYLKDKYNKEPFGLMLMSFIFGMVSIVPAIALEKSFGISPGQLSGQSISSVALFAYGVVALSEEGCKLLVVRLFCYPRKAFDDPFDGILYCVIVSMGFATLENIGYTLQQGIGTGITRMFLSVPAHATFAVLMGYHLALAKFNPKNKVLNFFFAIFWPVVFHGTFDFFLFLDNSLYHFAGALVSFVIAIYLSRRAIRKKQALSKAFIIGVEATPVK
jgi:RsiW-degrading membrane proteinase PrsW (M82 family)